MSAPMFCGRRLNHLTMTYDFSDGSDTPYPIEMQQDVFDDIELGKMNSYPGIAILTLFAWKDRLAATASPSPQESAQSIKEE